MRLESGSMLGMLTFSFFVTTFLRLGLFNENEVDENSAQGVVKRVEFVESEKMCLNFCS